MLSKRIIVILLVLISGCGLEKKAPIKVGVLHSLTGTMAFSERSVVDAVMLAIEQINLNGGVLGRQLVPVLADGASNNEQFAREAKRLIVDEQVAVIFGCWTSSSRKAVKPVVEKYQSLLFYPVQYEGLEQSPNIVYTGAAANQQIIPSLHWALKNIGTQVYLLGSDYIYPRSANLIIKDLLYNRNIKPLGERYVPLGSSDFGLVIEDIKRLKPQLIINTINGDSNLAFFRALKVSSLAKVLSYSIAEPEVQTIGGELMQGHYSAWNYFQSIEREQNQIFVADFKKKFGQQRVVNDPMEAAYVGVNLWAQAANTAATPLAKRVKTVLAYQSFNAPNGVVSIDGATQHLWKKVRIGRVLSNGQFEIVWESDSAIRPAPFPRYYDKQQWRTRIKSLGLSL